MTKVAVLLANGFEEIEALTQVDVFRRAEIECDMIGLTSQQVVGSHDILVLADKVFDGDLSAYDMIVLPGGLPGASNLRDHNGLIRELQAAAQSDKYVAAICAAPIVLDRAGLLDGKNYTCFPDQEEEIKSGNHVEEIVVVDGNIITSRGAGTSLAFVYKLVDLLGGDGKALSERMVYNELFK
ncbi:DJ-1 family protein [Streptococcus sp. X16XC17]|uniref:DJ-1 family glyoxalase III n=1 Tax=unclassified Streptococcus TaxID=2608887 RepID=UPI00066FE2ED|nr:MULTISPECIES: DJ-1 family glyoxalase III [unclassified Streptococcus]TCD46219.1 DJ-1 family protein [Streptococcus sp. X16XC17]